MVQNLNFQSLPLEIQNIIIASAGYDNKPQIFILSQVSKFFSENAVKLCLRSVTKKESKKLGKRLKNYPFITSLYSSKCITDGTLEKLTNLTCLSLNRTSYITNSALIKLTRLESLNLGKYNVITAHAISQLTNLTELDLSSSFRSIINDCNQAQSLRTLKNLKKICLSCYDEVSGELFQFLPSLTELDSWGHNNVNDIDLIKIGTQLKHLSLMRNGVTDFSLSTLTNLTFLHLDDEEGLVSDISILQLTKLKTLRLYNTQIISGMSLQTLTNLTELESFCNDKITDISLNKLTSLIKLEIGTEY